MQVRQLTEDQCYELLPRVRLVRLACSREGQPYIVPVNVAFHQVFLYGFSLPGQKVEWMRANPQVCVEWDQVAHDMDWTSLVILGTYEELPDTPDTAHERQFAHDLLERQRELWWQPGVASGRIQKPAPLEAVFFRIRIGQITGRRATP